jgi:hypothetical protein
MALWFEPETHFDIPDTSELLPAVPLGLMTTESEHFDQVCSMMLSVDHCFPVMQFVQLSMAECSVVRPEKKISFSPTNFENTSLPPGIPHYIFENVVELIKDNEPHEDILEMYVFQFVKEICFQTCRYTSYFII